MLSGKLSNNTYTLEAFMLAISLDEAEKQLLTVNAAIQEILAGKRITQLHIGSGNLTRTYMYQEINIEMLYSLRQELMEVIASYSTAPPKFGTNLNFPLKVTKGGL